MLLVALQLDNGDYFTFVILNFDCGSMYDSSSPEKRPLSLSHLLPICFGGT